MAIAESLELQAPAAAERPLRWRQARVLLRKKVAMVSLTFILIFYFCGIFAPLIAPYDPNDQPRPLTAELRNAGPSADHWAGTDNLGRDIFYRTLVATRLSIELALAATALAVVVGLALGAAPLLVGPGTGRLVTASVNIAVAFPGLLLALFFAVIFGVGATGAVLAIGLAGAPSFARLTHTLVASVAARDYVSAARAIGVGRFRVLTRHVLPNIVSSILVQATVSIPAAIIAEAVLSFLGLGVQPPTPSWGTMLNTAQAFLETAPWMAWWPGLAIFVLALSFNLAGDGVRDVLDPRDY